MSRRALLHDGLCIFSHFSVAVQSKTGRIRAMKKALIVLASLAVLSQVQAVSPTPGEAPAPNGANSTYNFHNSKFHGWWRNTMIGAMSGFAAGGPSTPLQDQYIYIDTSVYPVRVFTTYGTDRFPRLQPDAFDPRPIPLPHVPGVPTANSYFYKGPNELVNGYNPPVEGSFDPILSLINGDILKLINDRTISAFKYYNYHYSGQTSLAGLAIYKKMEHPPTDTSGLDWNDPVNLFKYYTSANTFANLSTSQRTGALNYVGKKAAEEITSRFLTGTFTKKTPLRKLRVTNTAYYTEIGIPNDAWTTIYFFFMGKWGVE